MFQVDLKIFFNLSDSQGSLQDFAIAAINSNSADSFDHKG